MKKYLAVLFISLTICAGALHGQIRYGGYMSFEYDKGQADTDAAKGTVRNILAGLMAGGVLPSKFAFGLEIQARTDSVFDLEQAWIGFVPSKLINVRGGLYLVPFGLWNRANRAYETPVIRTPLNLAFLYPQSWRDLGLTLEGQLAIFTYSVYLGNGLKDAANLESSQQFTDNNTDKAKGGRVGLVVSQNLQGGVSYYSGKYDNAGQLNLALEGVDFSWVTSAWELRGEFTKALIDNPTPFAEGKSEGFYIWAIMSYSHVQPIVSYQTVKYLDPNPAHFLGAEAPGEGVPPGISLSQRRWALGLRWTIGNNVFLKAEYDWNRDRFNPALKLNQLQIQAALSF